MLKIAELVEARTGWLEQMLDRHPLITGLGEREEIRRAAIKIPQRLGRAGPYFLHLDHIPATLLDELAASHLQTLRSLAGPGATRAVDKMPHNFLHLGLIAQMLPGARILHCVRDPVDTCFSCYRQRFGAGLPYTTRLEWLGVFYRAYAALMRHWSRVLPLPMMTVRYESLVASPEPVLREVMAFLDVPWEPRCLRFHESDRVIGTASHTQVQQPLYTSSVGRAAPYHHRLGPLRGALGMP